MADVAAGHLAGHVRRLGGEEEAQGGRDGVVGPGRDVHEVDRAPLADLLAQRPGDALQGTLGDALPGPSVDEPPIKVISTEELQSLVFCLGTGLSPLESDALRLYLEGNSYEEMAEQLDCDTKTIDNALQRVKRKVGAHLDSRAVLA